MDNHHSRTIEETNAKKNKRNIKIIIIIIYLTFCLILDSLLIPLIEWSIIGIISVEIAILFGVPKLIEWLRA